MKLAQWTVTTVIFGLATGCATCASQGEQAEPTPRAATSEAARGGEAAASSESEAHRVETPVTFTVEIPHRSRSAAVAIDDHRVLAIGGLDESLEAVAGAGIIDLANRSWTDVAPMDAARIEPAAVRLTDGRIFVTGGLPSQFEQAIAATEIYDVATDAWSTAAVCPFAAVGHRATLLADGRVVVTGGGTRSGPSVSRQAAIYDPNADSWTLVEDAPLPLRDHVAVLLPDETVFVAAGLSERRGVPSAGAAIFDPETLAWQRLPDMPRAVTRAAAVIGCDGRAVVAGGMTASGSTFAGVYAFDPRTSEWSTLSSLSVRRWGLGLAAWGEGLIAVGGETGSGYHRSTTGAVEILAECDGDWVSRSIEVSARHQAPLVSVGDAIVLVGGMVRGENEIGSNVRRDALVITRPPERSAERSPRARHP